MVEVSPAIIQAATTAAPKIFFLTRRCTNGRKVACVLSKEIAARFVTDANGHKRNITKIAKFDATVKSLVQKIQWLPKYQSRKIKRPPIKISAIARLITRYMLRFRRLRSFRYTMAVKAFKVAIATASMPFTVSQAIHSDEEINLRGEVVFCCCKRFPIYEKKDAAVKRNHMKLTTVKNRSETYI